MTATPNQDPLEVGDIIEIFINGVNSPYEYRVNSVLPNKGIPGRVNYTTSKRENSSSEWVGSLTLDNASDKYYTWRKKESVAVSVKQTYPNGCVCRRCNSRNHWAIPNQKDEVSYVCYECR